MAFAEVSERHRRLRTGASGIARMDWTRVLDVLVGTVGLIFIAPLLLVLAAIVFLQDGGAPIYRQTRLGRGGRTFKCLKFRSMVPQAQARLDHLLATDARARLEWETDHKLRNDPRITPLGRFIRKTSLDELPQLFNVIVGDMSLVGPRPIVQAEAVRYGAYLEHYFKVRPGITGVWQVSGRNDVSYRRRVACDVLYARRRSLQRNLMIMAATVPAVLQSRGSY
jgi:lipopolysaccharide/colanic/teichoic acid biosynthesis glycosyltransferase